MTFYIATAKQGFTASAKPYKKPLNALCTYFRNLIVNSLTSKFVEAIYVTGPAIIGHVGT